MEPAVSCPLCGKEIAADAQWFQCLDHHIFNSHLAVAVAGRVHRCWCGHNVGSQFEFAWHVERFGGLVPHFLAYNLLEDK